MPKLCQLWLISSIRRQQQQPQFWAMKRTMNQRVCCQPLMVEFPKDNQRQGGKYIGRTLMGINLQKYLNFNPAMQVTVTRKSQMHVSVQSCRSTKTTISPPTTKPSTYTPDVGPTCSSRGLGKEIHVYVGSLTWVHKTVDSYTSHTRTHD